MIKNLYQLKPQSFVDQKKDSWYNGPSSVFAHHPMNPDIVVVGAGPIGLFTAIEMKLHNPALQIKIVERNKQYSRHHILKLEEASLQNSLTCQTYEAVQKLHGFVPTSEIESTFLEIAQNLGIEIETGVKIQNPRELLKQYPTAHTVIGADGAHSTVRRHLFDDKKIVDTNLQYIVEIKYKAQGPTSCLSNLVYGPALGQINHFISENVGKEKNGETPVSLFIFVDKETYTEIRQVPNGRLTDLKPNSKRMKDLLNTLRPWLSLRKTAVGEAMVKNSEKINGVALSVYQSECFAKEIDEKRVYLVGDAAAAVPYFRALNAGLISATLTAKTIALADADKPDLDALNMQLATHANNEIARAHKENKKVNFGRFLNFFLANASKIATGAFMNADHHTAIVNARVTPPGIFRRNPRVLMTLGFFAMATGVAFVLALTVFSMAFIPAMLLSVAATAIFVTASVSLFKLTSFVLDKVKDKKDPIKTIPAFDWEMTDKKDQTISSSFSSLSKLNAAPGQERKDAAKTEPEAIEIRHYLNPLQNVPVTPENTQETFIPQI